jgi:uroporphyrinogen-III decarboxylase
MMIMVATRPDLVKHACGRFLTLATRRVREAAILGARAMWIVDGLTDVINPQAFASLNVPFMTQVVDEVRAAGLKSIYYFTGNPRGKWDLILSVGADALALEESKKGFEINIEDVVERVQGRCTLFGNLDAVGILQDGTDEQLRAEISRQIAAGRRNGHRFVMSVGSPVTPGTSVERVRMFCDLAHELGIS